MKVWRARKVVIVDSGEICDPIGNAATGVNKRLKALDDFAALDLNRGYFNNSAALARAAVGLDVHEYKRLIHSF